MSFLNAPSEHLHIHWSPVQRIAFRFLFVFLVLICNPWGVLAELPGFSVLADPLNNLEYWLVENLNTRFFQVKEELVAINGSGDTSYAWARLASFFLFTMVIGGIWNLIDYKRINYIKLDFLLTILVRYTLVYYAFSYGIIKVFSLQMPFPHESLLATPLGDLLPMRLSWAFFGYSPLFQSFSGIIELMVAGMLLFRATVPLGSLLALAVFTQVWMLNLSYDIPVKLFSAQLLLLSVYLVWLDRKRYLAFFFSNQSIEARTEIQPFEFWSRLRRWRIGIKALFMSTYVVFSVVQLFTFAQKVQAKPDFFPAGNGFYTLEMKISGNDTLRVILPKSEAWSDLIIHRDGAGSVFPVDTHFRKAYGRAYFNFEADSAKGFVKFKQHSSDSLSVYEFRFAQPAPQKLILTSQQDSNRLELHFRKDDRFFQLTERQFHWLSESNR
ncbi:MAG: hypothetical protein ACK5B6_07470 [Bacteroidia bacterium]